MNERGQIGPGRFRWRLTLAFVVVAAIAAGIVAGGSFYLVRVHRYESFLERSFSTATLASTVVETAPGVPVIAEELVEELDRRGRLEVVAVTPGGVASSDPALAPDDLPDLERDDTDEVRFGMTENDDEHYLVVSPVDADAAARLYFFFSTENLEASLQDLRRALVQSSLVVLAIAGLAGYMVARQTLRPVARASSAARALAEGLLETRLPVESHDEFGAWALSFNTMAEALQEKIEALTEAGERERRFTSNVAHELRTPLTALVTSASMLRSELDSMGSEARWASERLLSQVTRLRDLVEELLEISRLESGQQSVSYGEISPDHFLRALIRDRHWDEAVAVETDIESFPSDARRLERVLANLIDNALVHGGGSARVEVGSDNGMVRIAVHDAGPGIEDAHLENLFDRFYKTDPSRPGGSGLGLAIARENVRLLGGTIDVETEPGRGSSFVVSLPRRDVVLDH